jgi:hypothetical protein
MIQEMIARIKTRKTEIKIAKYRRNIKLIELNKQIFQEIDKFNTIDWHVQQQRELQTDLKIRVNE